MKNAELKPKFMEMIAKAKAVHTEIDDFVLNEIEPRLAAAFKCNLGKKWKTDIEGVTRTGEIAQITVSAHTGGATVTAFIALTDGKGASKNENLLKKAQKGKITFEDACFQQEEETEPAIDNTVLRVSIEEMFSIIESGEAVIEE